MKALTYLCVYPPQDLFYTWGSLPNLPPPTHHHHHSYYACMCSHRSWRHVFPRNRRVITKERARVYKTKRGRKAYANLGHETEYSRIWFNIILRVSLMPSLLIKLVLDVREDSPSNLFFSFCNWKKKKGWKAAYVLWRKGVESFLVRWVKNMLGKMT